LTQSLSRCGMVIPPGRKAFNAIVRFSNLNTIEKDDVGTA
jgi:hypothetical protein